jgi:hypothetical protein
MSPIKFVFFGELSIFSSPKKKKKNDKHQWQCFCWQFFGYSQSDNDPQQI